MQTKEMCYFLLFIRLILRTFASDRSYQAEAHRMSQALRLLPDHQLVL